MTTREIITPNRGFRYLGDTEEEFKLAGQMLEQQRRAGIKNKKPKTQNPDGNQGNPTTQLVLPDQDLQFVIKELYLEIRKYLERTFPNQNTILNNFNWCVEKDSDGKPTGREYQTGSNPFVQIAVDMFLKSQLPDFRIARQCDLETNLQMFKDFYIDSGLALRSLEEPNKTQAENLYKQLRVRGLTDPQIFPMFFDLRGLELSPNLEFKLTDESRYTKADCLNWQGGTKYSQTNEFGLPISKNTSGSRQIWTRESDLSRVYLNRISDLNSRFDDLADSNDDGRVVLAKPRSG